MSSKPRPKTKTTHHDLEKGNHHHSQTTTRPKPKSKASEPGILPHAAEDLTRTELNRHKKKAQKSLRNGDLTALVKTMWHIMYEEIDKPQQGHRKERKVHSLRLAEVAMTAYDKAQKGGALAPPSDTRDGLPKLQFRDRFWQFIIICYAAFTEGWGYFPGTSVKVGITLAPVAGNTFQMFCAPFIMVGIPKWTRTPPSVMYGVWWEWAKLTLLAYIPFLGTYLYVTKPPVTLATQRLIVYFKLRQLLKDDQPRTVINKRGRRKTMYVSQYLTPIIGREIMYSASMHRDITGEWRHCCSCFW